MLTRQRKAIPRSSTMPASAKALLMGTWLTEKKGTEVCGWDLAGLSPVTEALLVVTARSVRHAHGLADHLLERVGSEKMELLGMEGYRTGQWILMDFNDVLVNIFQPDIRQTFNLEGLWADATPIPMPAVAVENEGIEDDDSE